jgi:hypothetical protein
VKNRLGFFTGFPRRPAKPPMNNNLQLPVHLLKAALGAVLNPAQTGSIISNNSIF